MRGERPLAAALRLADGGLGHLLVHVVQLRLGESVVLLREQHPGGVVGGVQVRHEGAGVLEQRDGEPVDGGLALLRADQPGAQVGQAPGVDRLGDGRGGEAARARFE
ncbi:hypothetical protein GCM10020295_83520 [Streptomyces cinereospinus]